MTLQLLHSEFPYIWGNFDILFYQCFSAYLVPTGMESKDLKYFSFGHYLPIQGKIQNSTLGQCAYFHCAFSYYNTHFHSAHNPNMTLFTLCVFLRLIFSFRAFSAALNFILRLLLVCSFSYFNKEVSEMNVPSKLPISLFVLNAPGVVYLPIFKKQISNSVKIIMSVRGNTFSLYTV